MTTTLSELTEAYEEAAKTSNYLIFWYDGNDYRVGIIHGATQDQVGEWSDSVAPSDLGIEDLMLTVCLGNGTLETQDACALDSFGGLTWLGNLTKANEAIPHFDVNSEGKIVPYIRTDVDEPVMDPLEDPDETPYRSNENQDDDDGASD